jgi:hypothetical protein
MNMFWKTILTAVLGAASLVGARYSANWIADHTYRANRASQSERVQQLQRAAIERAARQAFVPMHVTAPRAHRLRPNRFPNHNR